MKPRSPVFREFSYCSCSHKKRGGNSLDQENWDIREATDVLKKNIGSGGTAMPPVNAMLERKGGRCFGFPLTSRTKETPIDWLQYQWLSAPEEDLCWLNIGKPGSSSRNFHKRLAEDTCIYRVPIFVSAVTPIDQVLLTNLSLFWRLTSNRLWNQGSYGSCKTWKVVEFKCFSFQVCLSVEIQLFMESHGKW